MLPMPAAAPFDSPDYAFDVAWDGVRALAAIDRGKVTLWGRGLADLTGRYPRLNEVLQSSGRIYVVEPVADDGLAFFDAARDKGLDGVVAKRFDSPYRAGQRHPDWLAIDAIRRQDFAVMGFVPEAGDNL